MILYYRCFPVTGGIEDSADIVDGERSLILNFGFAKQSHAITGVTDGFRIYHPDIRLRIGW